MTRTRTPETSSPTRRSDHWSNCKTQVASQIVRIQTDDRSGTGFIFRDTDGGNRSIATAPHLVG